MNKMFTLFMSNSITQAENSNDTKRKLNMVQEKQAKGCELPRDKMEASFQLNSMEEDNAAYVDQYRGRPTVIHGKRLVQLVI
jgi:hypothetical protein